MEQFRYTKEWEDKCRYSIGWKKSCADCLFEALCMFEKNKDKTWKHPQESKKDLEKK